jgi:hypothetical protein
MPADVPGVTTEGQTPPGAGGDDPTSESRDGATADALAAQGLPTPSPSQQRAGDPATDASRTRRGNGGEPSAGGDGSTSGSAAAAAERRRWATAEALAQRDRAATSAGPPAATVADPSDDPVARPATSPVAEPGATGPAVAVPPAPEVPAPPGPAETPAAGSEVPPAPVLPGEWTRRPRPRLRARHAARRRDRASRRGLRINQRLWAIDVWSVFKISALFYLCMALILLVAGTLLYNAGRSIGTVDQFESFITRIGAYGECMAKGDVPAGTEFEEDDACDDGEVLVGGFTLDDGTLFRVAAIGGAVLVVAGSIGNVLLTVLLNLLSEATGGLRHTIIREPVQRPPGAGPGGPDRAGAARGADGDARAAQPRVRTAAGPSGDGRRRATGSPPPRVRR